MLFPKTKKPFIILRYTKYRTAANDSEQLWNNKKLGDSKRHSLFAKGVPIQLSTHKTPECTWTHTNKPHLQNPSEKKMCTPLNQGPTKRRNHWTSSQHTQGSPFAALWNLPQNFMGPNDQFEGKGNERCRRHT